MQNIKLFCLITVITCTMCVNNLLGQGAYVNINAGYGLNLSSQNLYYFDFYNYTSTPNSITEEQVDVSLGNGLNFGGAFGYMFNKNFGAELGLSYLLEGKATAKDVFSLGTTDYTFSSKMFRINPSLVISSGLDRLNPYAKFGVVIGKGSVNYDIEDYYDGDISKVKVILDGGLALGLNAAIGTNFKLKEKMSLFGEINMINMSYAPSKGVITEATYNGVDELPYMTTSEKEIEFVESYTVNYNNPPSDSEPTQELEQKLPFGSIGINLGLRIDL